MVNIASHAYRVVNELSLQTQDLVRLREQLIRMQLAEAERARIGHVGRLFAYFGGVAAIGLNILGTAPAERWQYGWSIGLLLALGALLIVAELWQWSSHSKSEEQLREAAAALSSEAAQIQSEMEFVDNYRECVMLRASLDVLAQDEAFGRPLVAHWKRSAELRLAGIETMLATDVPNEDRRLSLETQANYLRAALLLAAEPGEMQP